MKHRLLKAGALVALAATFVVAGRAHALDNSDSLEACFDRAADSFVSCVDSHAWYVAALCELRYNADMLLCFPAAAISKFGPAAT